MVQLAAAIRVSYNEFGSVEKVFFMADSATVFLLKISFLLSCRYG